MKTESLDCKKYTINQATGNYYITCTDKSVMAHRPREGDMENATEYTLLNSVCRLASKLRGKGYSWKKISHQLSKSGIGYKTVVDEIALILAMEHRKVRAK